MCRCGQWQVRLVPRNLIHLGPSYMMQWSSETPSSDIMIVGDHIFFPWKHQRISPFTPSCKLQGMTRRWVSDFQQKHNKQEALSLPLQQVLQYYRTVNLTHPPEQSWGRTSGLQAFQTLHGLLQSKRRRQRISRSRAFSLGGQLFSTLPAEGSLAHLSAQT